MLKKLSRTTLFYLSFLINSLMFPVAIKAQAALWTGECIYRADDGEKVATLKGVGCMFENILYVSLRLIGIVTFIMLLVGGFKYLTAGGDPKNTESAQKTLTLAIAGLVLAIGAWFILSAISGFTGLPDLLNFTFGLPDTP